MRIRILGTRGEIGETARYHSRHSGILIDGALLVDLGEPEFLAHALKAVLITHLHPDHAYFVRSGAARPPAAIPIYAPEPHPKAALTVLGEAKTIAGYDVRPVPTHHSLKVRSQAYLVGDGSAKILYTGDMIWINKEHHPLLEDLDLVITEASYFRKGGLVKRDKLTGTIYGHTGVPDLVRLFKDYARRIVLVHLGSWFYKDIPRARRAIAALGRETGVRLEPGHDGQEIVI